METKPAVIADTRYGRQRIKKQFTFRVDEELAMAVVACAESKGLRLSDAIEAGLVLWLREQGERPPAMGKMLE